jgi:hypothetical protein
MSTKKLSRTVIEGGRHSYNKWERRHSHAEVRAEERDYLKQVMSNLELAEELEIGEKRPVMKEFTDKLAPMYRWLETQVGRPWSEVRSEVFTKFDTRTTAGRHITFDHLLREIVETDSGFDNRGHIPDPNIPKTTHGRYYYGSYASYYVDQTGILRAKEHSRYHQSWYWEKISDQEYKDAEAWLQNRMVGEKDGKLYWYVPTQGVWKASWFEPFKAYDTYTRHELCYCSLENGLYEVMHPSLAAPQYGITGKAHGDYWQKVEKPSSFRRRGELTSTEVKTFRSFKKRIQNDILSFTKDR